MATKKSSPIIEFLMVIVERGKIEKAITILQNMRVDAQVVSFGKGTTDSSIAEYFGTDGKEKEVLFAIIKLRDEETILNTLSEKLKFEEKNTGLALTLPIKSATYSTLEVLGFAL